MDKQALALAKREQRQNYSVVQRMPWDRVIHDDVVAIAEAYQIIGVYAAYMGEVDTYGIIETLLWDVNKIIVLPRIEAGTMNFYRIQSLDDLEVGHFGILEPRGNASFVPEMMVVPMSAFNTACHRIGYGKGYYDRYLSAHPSFKVGVAYDFQKIDASFEDQNDIACDVIVTEKELYYVT